MNIFKKETKENAKQLPRIYYAKHITAGVAQYYEATGPEMILVQLDTLKKMNPSYKGKPVYVQHVNEVNLEKLQEEAAGYVVESIYNPLDGAMWAKMVIVSDEGHQVIAQDWKVSNSYIITSIDKTKGTWHNVDYDAEVMAGEYNHLALVPNPRYEEAVILTEEAYKQYNAKKEEELKNLQNAKGEKPMFNLFKKSKVENTDKLDLKNTYVAVNGKDVSLEEMIKNVVDFEKKEEPKKNEEVSLDLDKKVKVGDNEMSIKELVNKFQDMLVKHSVKEVIEEVKKDEVKPEEKKEIVEEKKADDSEVKEIKEEKKSDDDDKKEIEEKKEASMCDDKKNDEEKEKLEKKNAEEQAEILRKEEEAKKIALENMKKLEDAEKIANSKEQKEPEISSDRVERGKRLYGSKK